MKKDLGAAQLLQAKEPFEPGHEGGELDFCELFFFTFVFWLSLFEDLRSSRRYIWLSNRVGVPMGSLGNGGVADQRDAGGTCQTLKLGEISLRSPRFCHFGNSQKKK